MGAEEAMYFDIPVYSNLQFFCKSDLSSFDIITFFTNFSLTLLNSEFNSESNFNEDLKYERG